jgi:flagellar basal body rod protein FlgB
MLFGLIDRASNAAPLRAALDQSVARSRAIADRVAQASVNNGDGFSLNAKGSAGAQGNDVNLETEMANLGDESLRFLATSRLLEKTYQSLRSAISGTK